MLIIGLTGSIGMGKSETAAMFRRLDIPVFDADAVVHELYEAGGEAVGPIAEHFPEAVHEAAVDRQKLAMLVLGDRDAIGILEGIVHPLVREREKDFLAKARDAGREMVVLDIPLLFESGGEGRVHKIIVVSAPASVQRTRVLARPGMTPSKFEAILEKQMPDSKKRERADFVVDTSVSLEDAFAQVSRIVAQLRSDS